MIGLSRVEKKIEHIGGIEIKTKVAWALIEEVPPLLGRQDIFDKFHIIFKQDKEQITFEERR